MSNSAVWLLRIVIVAVAVSAIGGIGPSPAVAQAAASVPGRVAVGAGAAAAEGGSAVSMGEPTVTHPVAAALLERGEVLTANDIRYVALPAGESAPESAPATMVGWTTRRVIQEGEPLRPPAVSPPDLVRAGDAVDVLYQGESVVLRVKGTAAGSAAMGERVLVRVDARRRLEGVVIGPALVQLKSSERR